MYIAVVGGGGELSVNLMRLRFQVFGLERFHPLCTLHIYLLIFAQKDRLKRSRIGDVSGTHTLEGSSRPAAPLLIEESVLFLPGEIQVLRKKPKHNGLCGTDKTSADEALTTGFSLLTLFSSTFQNTTAPSL